MHSDHACENAVPASSPKFCVNVRKRHHGGGVRPPSAAGNNAKAASTSQKTGSVRNARRA